MFPRPIIAVTLVVAFISQDVSGGNVTNSSSSSLQTSTPSPTVSNFSRTVTTQITTSTRSQNQTATTTTSQTQIVTTTTTKNILSPSSSTTVVPSSSPPNPTCGTVSFVWEKPWNDSYENNDQFEEQTSNTLKTALKDKVFNDISKYDDVKVSELTVKKKGDWILVEFKLCLVMQDAKEGYLEDELKKWKKFVNESVTEVDFGASEVTLTKWKAKANECSKCPGVGPFTIERECKPKEAKYSCNGVKTRMESVDCLEYCSKPASGAQKISPFDVVLGILLAFSVNFWK